MPQITHTAGWLLDLGAAALGAASPSHPGTAKTRKQNAKTTEGISELNNFTYEH